MESGYFPLGLKGTNPKQAGLKLQSEYVIITTTTLRSQQQSQPYIVASDSKWPSTSL